MLLHTDNLTKHYGTTHALHALNLTVHKGEIFGLLGPNGSGKSTALRLLLGFLRPTSGRATIAGHDCWHESVAARKQVAYLPGELRLYENMTGRQLARLLAELRGQPQYDKLDQLAKRFDIDLHRPIAGLSSGMKRKVALMQVLIPHVPLLILDEPTNTLDPTMRDELLDQIVKAKEDGKAVLFSSHVLSEVERVCDRVAILQGGKLVHLQDMTELRQGRLIHARFPKPIDSVPEFPGLSVRERHDSRLVLEHQGALSPVLSWLADRSVEDLSVEPLGLGPIYHRYHGSIV